MEIIPYDTSLLQQVTYLYNRTVAAVPHCFPIGAEQFGPVAAACEGSPSGERLREEQILVALDEGEACGFVHVAIGRLGRKTNPESGFIRFLCYVPGRRVAGQALLAAAEEYLQEREMKEVLAFDSDLMYEFYHLPHAYLSDRLAHIHALLGQNGYKRSHGEVFLDWPEYPELELIRPGVEARIVVESEDGKGKRPDLTLVAKLEDKSVGVCANYSSGRPWRPDVADDWFHTHWLAVDEPYRRRGLGWYLLQRSLAEMRANGYRHAAISTDFENHRALLFYSNFGYHVVDWTYALSRHLGRRQ